jgi:hypothetical protein
VPIVSAGKQKKLTIDVTRSQWEKLASSGSALISFETPNDEVQALFVPDFNRP